jgi:hypothetical protein
MRDLKELRQLVDGQDYAPLFVTDSWSITDCGRRR